MNSICADNILYILDDDKDILKHLEIMMILKQPISSSLPSFNFNVFISCPGIID